MKISTGRLEIEWAPVGRDHHIAIRGHIDERSDLQAFSASLESRVTMDLERVTFINSIGVREWVRLLRGLKDRRVQVVLKRCSEAMVHQMNMIIEMQAGATVESFFAPFLCEQCGHEASLCIDIKQHLPSLRRMEPPPMPCVDCGGTMQFNEIPGRYFLFLAQAA